MAIITAVAIVGGVVGGIIYKNKHDEAYARCQTAVSEFSEARKALLDTTSDSPALQKLVRNALGVDKILDAAADAASAAEGTVAQQGCAANATITQLNLVANTLNSATESLRKSTAQIVRGASADTDTTGDESESAASSDTEDVAQAKKNLQEAIDQARAARHTQAAVCGFRGRQAAHRGIRIGARPRPAEIRRVGHQGFALLQGGAGHARRSDERGERMD